MANVTTQILTAEHWQHGKSRPQQLERDLVSGGADKVISAQPRFPVIFSLHRTSSFIDHHRNWVQPFIINLALQFPGRIPGVFLSHRLSKLHPKISTNGPCTSPGNDRRCPCQSLRFIIIRHLASPIRG